MSCFSNCLSGIQSFGTAVVCNSAGDGRGRKAGRAVHEVAKLAFKGLGLYLACKLNPYLFFASVVIGLAFENRVKEITDRMHNKFQEGTLVQQVMLFTAGFFALRVVTLPLVVALGGLHLGAGFGS